MTSKAASYDHVTPPAVEDEHLPWYDVGVPMFIISPCVGRSVVRSELYDHTSIIKTILARFVDNPLRLSTRVDHARGRSLAFTEPFRRDTPAALSVDLIVPKSMPTGDPTDLAPGLAALRRRCATVRLARTGGVIP